MIDQKTHYSNVVVPSLDRRANLILEFICTTVMVGMWLITTALAEQESQAAQQPHRSQLVGISSFTNVGVLTTDKWISVGLVETITAALPHVIKLSGSSEELNISIGEDSALQNARQRGIKWLITGDYQRVADRVQITTRLVNTQAGITVESFAVAAEIGELFTLQDSIVELVTLALNNRDASATERPALNTNLNPTKDPLRTPLETPSSQRPDSPSQVIEGPAPPTPPATIARNESGRATLRATRLTGSIRLDGILDEPIYQTIEPASDFIQVEPRAGELATEQTEVWIVFDNDNLYVSALCFDSAPESEWVANEMRRDGQGLGEFVGIILDTFYDRRNAVELLVNPLGGRMDGQITNERQWNGDWNPVWEVRSGRFDSGWTFEAAIPFKSLRYQPASEQVWGITIERRVAWKNEYSAIVPLNPAWGMGAGMNISRSATLVGLEVPDVGLNLEIKPYAIGELNSTTRSTILKGDAGLDVKYQVTENFVSDFTFNTDFAQVEADQQQINLTRFSLFFPEKREFFLENRGVFSFGGDRGGGFFGGGSNTPILFYSRRIGLNDEQEVPIIAGGRLTGRAGKFTVGLLNVQTGDAAATNARRTNFSVLRLRRDILRRSSVGLMFTNRSVSRTGIGSNETYGVDGLFSFYDNLSISTYWAKTSTPGLGDDEVSHRAQLDYRGDRYGVQLERLSVGADFNPEIGFLRRDDFDRSFASFRFSPRPISIAAIRKFTWEGKIDYITDRKGILETRQAQGMFGVEFENNDQFDITYTRNHEFIKDPFEIAKDVTIPVRGYTFEDVEAAFTLGQSRPFQGTVSIQQGSFYGGTKTTVGFGFGRRSFSGSRIELTSQLAMEPVISFNRVDLPEGRFTTQLVSNRAIFAFTPLMFASALVQYNSNTNAFSTNLRVRWEYRPGSELFIVFNDERDTLRPQRLSHFNNRALIIKFNRLLRF